MLRVAADVHDCIRTVNRGQLVARHFFADTCIRCDSTCAQSWYFFRPRYGCWPSRDRSTKTSFFTCSTFSTWMNFQMVGWLQDRNSTKQRRQLTVDCWAANCLCLFVYLVISILHLDVFIPYIFTDCYNYLYSYIQLFSCKCDTD